MDDSQDQKESVEVCASNLESSDTQESDLNADSLQEHAPSQHDVPHTTPLPEQNVDTDIPLIDIHKFADHATTISKQHIAQISESNRRKLQELINNQGVLLESLEHENEKFSANNCFKHMEDTMSKCKHYNTKLLRIQKMMHNISQRTAKVKKQCSKLQALKARSVMEEEEVKRKELEREHMLEARPVNVEPDIATSDSA